MKQRNNDFFYGFWLALCAAEAGQSLGLYHVKNHGVTAFIYGAFWAVAYFRAARKGRT